MKDIFRSEAGRQLVLGTYKEILAAWPVRNRQYTVETDYGSTFVIESGSETNPPLILLHGSVSNSFTWFGDVEKLSRTHHVFAIDLIGEAGFSAPGRPAYESGAYPEWLKEVIGALGLSSCSIAGLSLGGWMALSFATEYPGKVDRLVLLCPGGLARVKAGFKWKVIFYALFGKWGEKQTVKLISGPMAPAVPDPGMEKGMAYTALITKHFNPRMAALPIFGDEALSRLTMPVLLLFGEFDNLLQADKSIERVKRLVPHAEAELLKGCGHAVVNQADRITRFLES